MLQENFEGENRSAIAKRHRLVFLDETNCTDDVKSHCFSLIKFFTKSDITALLANHKEQEN
jgi:hypothetical protein